MVKARVPQNLSERAYQFILNRILSGDLPLGSPVTRRPVAKRLGISLIPVAAALNRLESEGLVESLPCIGTRVRVPTAEDIVGHYQLREALEVHSARLFAETASTEERAALCRLAARLDASYQAIASKGGASGARLFEIHKAHSDFHLRVVRDTRCKPLIDALERSHVLIFNWLYNTASQFESIPPRWHLDLAEALARDGVEGADRAMRVHVRYGKEVVLMRLAGMAEEIRRATRSYRGRQQRNKPAGTGYEEAHHL
jgi:DNA-binding GntR family transcriptional regulator